MKLYVSILFVLVGFVSSIYSSNPNEEMNNAFRDYRKSGDAIVKQLREIATKIQLHSLKEELKETIPLKKEEERLQQELRTLYQQMIGRVKRTIEKGANLITAEEGFNIFKEAIRLGDSIFVEYLLYQDIANNPDFLQRALNFVQLMKTKGFIVPEIEKKLKYYLAKFKKK